MDYEINKSNIEDTLNKKFFNNIYDGIVSYISQLDSSDISNYFEEDIEFAEVASIKISNLIKYNGYNIENKNGIDGTVEIKVSLDGYIFLEDYMLVGNVNQCVDSTEILIDMDFDYYYDDQDGAKDFEILELYF